MKSLEWGIGVGDVRVYKMRAFILGCVLLLSGCGTLQEEYVKADELDYAVFTPLFDVWMAEEPGVAIPLDETNLENTEDYVELLKLKWRLRGQRIMLAKQLIEEAE
jgi:hypothetical protein